MAAKEADLKNLSAAYEGIQYELSQMRWKNMDLKDQIEEFKEEVSRTDYDDLRERYDAAVKDYDELMTASMETAAVNARLLDEKKREKNQIVEKFELAVARGDEYRAAMAELTRERDELKREVGRVGEEVREEKTKTASLRSQIRAMEKRVAEDGEERRRMIRRLAVEREELEKEAGEFKAEILKLKAMAAGPAAAGSVKGGGRRRKAGVE